MKGDWEMSLFYWHSKIENGNTLEEELLNIRNVKFIRIATAYFSKEGLDILKKVKDKYSLKKVNIELYLSPEFSVDSPHKLLKELIEICNVYIVLNIKFHPKVYWLKSVDKSKLIFGSSNFTKGGFVNNIEFNNISFVDSWEEVKLERFFNYCKNNSDIVSDEIIKFYKDKEKELNKLKDVEKRIKKSLYAYQRRNDEFDQDKYDLNEMYFKYEDYETLFERNQKLDEYAINNRRKVIKDKLLKIHDSVYSTLKKENIYCHWRKDNITSLIRPCKFNNGKVAWVGVRYGKSKREIDELKYGVENDEDLGFQKHACLQFSIAASGFEVNLFHAVRRDAIDRNYMHENIDKYKYKIENELDKLKGEGLKWVVYDKSETKSYVFDIDNKKSEEFIEFYKKYDEDGRESYLLYYLPPDDVNLKNLSSISKFVIDKIKILVPLYNLLAFRLSK